MTDQELLMAAAKAEGRALTWKPSGPHDPATGIATMWNPLADDGDALRLAVTLKLHVGYSGGNQYFAGPSDSDKGVMRESGEKAGKQDPAAATRRAIVRAAAAMAK